MRIALVLLAIIMATPAYAFFNSYASGYLLGTCFGFNPTCWIGKSLHDSNNVHSNKENEDKEKKKENEGSTSK